MQPEKIKDLAEEDDECEVYEDEDFVTVSSSLAPSVSENLAVFDRLTGFVTSSSNVTLNFIFLRFSY